MGGLTVKKLSFTVGLALAFGLCTAPMAHAAKCTGDPVYDPGGVGPCYFGLTPAMPGAEATVKGRWFDRMPYFDPQTSYVKDTADDGMDAYLWVRYTNGTRTSEELLARASGPGATAAVRPFAPFVDSFSVRVCVGEGTTACSDWRT